MPERLPAAKAALAGARELYSAEQVSAAYDALAAAITERLADANPLVICVMIGGLQPTAEILRRLDFPHQQDYLHATRYRGETRGGELVWKARPTRDLRDRDLLVIDDILDEGHTLAAIIKALRAEQPRSITTAVLVEKQHDRRAPGVHADLVGLRAPDRYLVGCGMDYHDYFRNLDCIMEIG